MQIIKRYHDLVVAGLAQGFLQDNGVDAFVADEALASSDPRLVFASGGVRLMVSDEDAESAARILQEFESLKEGRSEDVEEKVSEQTNVSLEVAKFGLKFFLHAFIGCFVLMIIVVMLLHCFGGD